YRACRTAPRLRFLPTERTKLLLSHFENARLKQLSQCYPVNLPAWAAAKRLAMLFATGTTDATEFC
ncbi:MAG: hypothetical protein VB858_05930, partial [Planctomycetaceae bacterium]